MKASAFLSVMVSLALLQPVGAADAPGANGGLPAFIKPGFRLTWIGGSSIVGGNHPVQDENGPIEIDGRRYRLESNRPGGGMGYTQLNILHADAKTVIADVNLFILTDVNQKVCKFSGKTVVIGSPDALGDYWVNPAKLAQMPDGRQDGDKYTRGRYNLDNREYKSISITHQGNDGYQSKTYDLASGVMLFGGTTDINLGLLLKNKDNGQLTQEEANKQFSHNQFVAVRETKIPWAAAPRSELLSKGRRLDYTGGQSLMLPDAGGLPPLPPQAMSLSYEVSDILGGNCFSLKTLIRADLGPGIPPNEVRGEQVCGSAMLGGLYTPPDALRAIQPNTVLDEDPITHRRITYIGQQGNMALMLEQGRLDVLERWYDMGTGLLSASRYTTEPAGNVGKTILEFRLTGQN